jgi:hypothetical protein
MSDSKPMISTGSMLNSSEGLLSASAMAALAQQMTSSEGWVAAAACLGLALVAATYCVMRSKVKLEEEA